MDSILAATVTILQTFCGLDEHTSALEPSDWDMVHLCFSTTVAAAAAVAVLALHQPLGTQGSDDEDTEPETKRRRLERRQRQYGRRTYSTPTGIAEAAAKNLPCRPGLIPNESVFESYQAADGFIMQRHPLTSKRSSERKRYQEYYCKISGRAHQERRRQDTAIIGP